MIRQFIICVLTLALFACTNRNSPIQGMHSLDEARRAADQLIIEASPRNAWRSIDRSGIPADKVEAYWKFWSEGWRKAKVRGHYKWTRVMTLPEYLDFLREVRKDSPEWMKEEGDRWNFEPEHILVYWFEMNEEKASASAHFALGIFKRDGLWYFSAQMK